MLPTQILRYFRVLILLVALVNGGLIMEFWVDYNRMGFEDEIAWNVLVGHAVALLLTPVSAFVAFVARPRWLLANSRFGLMLLAAVVLLVAKTYNVSKYAKLNAEHNQICNAASDDIIICRPEQRRLLWIVMGMNETLCAFVLAVLVIAEAIVSLRMDKRVQNTSKLAAAQDLESKQPAEKA
ncbi:MAG: hypothetical protein JOS17DRAFT_766205 [Linnemannia elongata]|nr:MAG: hypothetical protein JOS17DRAFT_766205 [Linnemannia elongata]